MYFGKKTHTPRTILSGFLPDCSTRAVSGLTFMETLVTLFVFTIISVTLVNSILLFYRSNASSIEQSYQLQSARRGIELLVRDVREASYADSGAYPLSSISTTSISFFADTDRDNAAEKITYSLQGSSFSRTVVDPSGNPPVYTGVGTTSIVSKYVRNNAENVPVFQYFNASSTVINNFSDIANVRSVTVTLIVNIDPRRDPGEFTLRSSATLRNLRAQ